MQNRLRLKSCDKWVWNLDRKDSMAMSGNVVSALIMNDRQASSYKDPTLGSIFDLRAQFVIECVEQNRNSECNSGNIFLMIPEVARDGITETNPVPVRLIKPQFIILFRWHIFLRVWNGQSNLLAV